MPVEPIAALTTSLCGMKHIKTLESRVLPQGLSFSGKKSVSPMENQGFSNVPWHKRAFGSGTKYGFKGESLGILGPLCTGKGVPLVRYLCAT